MRQGTEFGCRQVTESGASPISEKANFDTVLGDRYTNELEIAKIKEESVKGD